MRFIFGNTKTAFETKTDAIEYLRLGLQNENHWRYRHSVARNDAESIIFSYEGELLAELVVEDTVNPTADDLRDWDIAKKVYLIREIRMFRDNTVKAADVGLINIQFGKDVSDGIYNIIINAVGGFGEIISK